MPARKRSDLPPVKRHTTRKVRSTPIPVAPRLVKKALFIRALAEYLCGNQATMSILLEMVNEHAKKWAKLRALSPVVGYETVGGAEAALTDFLG